MNERIKELAKNDLIRDEYTEFGWQECHYYRFDPDELQKFAELLLKECVDICNRVYFENYPDAEDFERSQEGDAIKKHFGVQE